MAEIGDIIIGDVEEMKEYFEARSTKTATIISTQELHAHLNAWLSSCISVWKNIKQITPPQMFETLHKDLFEQVDSYRETLLETSLACEPSRERELSNSCKKLMSLSTEMLDADIRLSQEMRKELKARGRAN